MELGRRNGGFIRPIPLGCGAAVLFACLVLARCLEAESSRCSWGGYCSPGMSCHDESEQCVVPSQLVDCLGKQDGVPCGVFGQTAPFLCRRGVCLRSVCGDGLLDDRVEAGEVCDDGNIESGDGCRADCRGTEICGDGQLDDVAGEACDDENQDNEDGCTELCQPPFCGDGLRTGGEACDDGEQNSDTLPNACRTSCRLPGRDDRVLDGAERGQCWLLTADGRQALNVANCGFETLNVSAFNYLLRTILEEGSAPASWLIEARDLTVVGGNNSAAPFTLMLHTGHWYPSDDCNAATDVLDSNLSCDYLTDDVMFAPGSCDSLSSVPNAEIIDGRLVAGGPSTTLWIVYTVLGLTAGIVLHNARMEADISVVGEQVTVHGILAGVMCPTELMLMLGDVMNVDP